MAQKFTHIDASFLAGECDPAIIARVDDVVRANAASRIRNMYVRSTGGVRSRPGMRLARRFESRQFSNPAEIADTTIKARIGQEDTTDPSYSREGNLVEVEVPPTQFIPPWIENDPVLIELDFGRVLTAGTQITVRLRHDPQVPEGYVTRLYWWEEVPDDVRDTSKDIDGSTQTTKGGAVGKWRSGAGLVDGREGYRDSIYINQVVYKAFSHTLINSTQRLRIVSREWRGGTDDPIRGRPLGVQPAKGSRYGVLFAEWGGEYVRIGSGRRPAVRLIDATWFPDRPYLLALHGAQRTLFEGSTIDDIISHDVNPQGFGRSETSDPYTPEEVHTIQYSKTPEGLYLYSQRSARWKPDLLKEWEADIIDIREAEVVPPGTFRRGGSDIQGWGSFQPASAMLAHQGRLLVAGTANAPNAVWVSKHGDRNNFKAPTLTQSRQLLATDPFMVQEVGRPLNRIVAMHAGLLIVFFGTHGISHWAPPGGVLSATGAVGFQENAERGIKVGVPPVEIGTGRLVFVERDGKSVWLMNYANERQGYVLSELSHVAPHLLDDPIDCIFYPSLPDGATAVLIVNEDGSIAVCSIQPENEWHAWSKWTSGEEGADGRTDILDVEEYEGNLWAVTRRGEVDKGIYLEQFDDEIELDFCWVSKIDDDGFAIFDSVDGRRVPTGGHPYVGAEEDDLPAFSQWAAVLVLSDGSRVRLGMGVIDERFERKLTASQNARTEAQSRYDQLRSNLPNNTARTALDNQQGTLTNAITDQDTNAEQTARTAIRAIDGIVDAAGEDDPVDIVEGLIRANTAVDTAQENLIRERNAVTHVIQDSDVADWNSQCVQVGGVPSRAGW